MGINFDIITVIHQASITDWIQAIAALLAVVGTVATLWKLYKRDEQKQAMIEELKVQSGAATEQAKHLGEQVTQLSSQVFHLKNIHEAIAEGIRIMAKSEELNERIRKIKIRPNFEWVSSMFKPGHVEAVFHFTNRGGTARNFAARIIKGDDAQIRLPEVVHKDGELVLQLRAGGKMKDLHPHIEILFDDDEGTRYYQRLYMDPVNLRVTEPALK